MKGLFISGSGTDVGKTFIAQKLICLLSESRQVGVRKPVESACQLLGDQLITKDAQALLDVSNVNDTIDVVCPYKFAQCSSGESASIDSKTVLTLEDLFNACQSENYVVVEGAGGLLSPLAQNSLNVDLAVALNLPLVIVVKDELGGVNQALLTIKVARQYQLKIACVILNQFEDNALENASAIRRYGACEVVVYNQNSSVLFEQKIRQLFNV
ncbi:dethiobiotin synthase [Candidatus Thioglobus sp.]